MKQKTAKDYQKTIIEQCNTVIKSIQKDNHNKEMLKFFEREMVRIVACLTPSPIYVDLAKDRGGNGTGANPFGFSSFKRLSKLDKNIVLRGSRA